MLALATGSCKLSYGLSTIRKSLRHIDLRARDARGSLIYQLPELKQLQSESSPDPHATEFARLQFNQHRSRESEYRVLQSLR